MSIETLLSELKASVDRNTEALLALAKGGSAPAATTEKKETVKTEKKETTKTEKKEEAKLTQDQVNAALIKLKDKFGMEHAKAIISEQGKAAKMAEIKPAQFQAVYDAAVAKYEELENGGKQEEAGDDL